MKERLSKYGVWIGAVLFYLFCFLVFAIVTFPFDRLKDRVIATFNAQQKPGSGQQELRIGEMSSSWITGVKMTDVKILSAPTEAGKPPSELKIEQARVRVSLLSLLIGNLSLSFKLNAFGGIADGSFTNSGKERDVDVTLEDLDLSQFEPLVAAVGLPLEGKLGGRINLKLPEGKASKGTGTVNFEAKEVAVGDGKAKLQAAMGLALPRLNIGELTFSADAREGVLKVTKFDSAGKDLDLHGEGRIEMKELATDSLCNVNIRFKINDSYKNKSESTKQLFGPGAVIEFDPKVKSSKRSDGFYGWTINGKLGNPKFTPAGGAIGASPSNPLGTKP